MEFWVIQKSPKRFYLRQDYDGIVRGSVVEFSETDNGYIYWIGHDKKVIEQSLVENTPDIFTALGYTKRLPPLIEQRRIMQH